jgi:hypothetical protein
MEAKAGKRFLTRLHAATPAQSPISKSVEHPGFPFRPPR